MFLRLILNKLLTFTFNHVIVSVKIQNNPTMKGRYKMKGWRIKAWKLDERNKMLAWCKKNESKYQINEIFINNAWAIEYKPLMHI